jgi:glycosyltransferase involved in cell wall biosynthesis
MRICQVVPYFPPHIGGEETFVFGLSRELAARGHDVTVFTSSENRWRQSQDTGGARVNRLNVLMKVYNNPIAPSLFHELLQEEQYNVLHAHQYPVFFSDVSAVTSFVKRIPFLLHVHVIPEQKSLFSSAALSFYYRLLWKLTSRPACRIVVPSLEYRALLMRLGVCAGKIRIIPYGVDTKRFSLDNDGESFRKKIGCEGSRIVLAVGRLNYQKGFHILIRALPLVVNEFRDVKLVIVGEGEERERLRELAERLNVAGNVVFTGALLNEELPKAYACADVFVLPSFFESFGITLIEAQATGKPVVGTKVGGVPEAVLNHESGMLVEPGKAGDLAEAIVTILSDKAMASKMGKKGRKHIEENFAFSVTVDKVIRLYEEASDDKYLSL